MCIYIYIHDTYTFLSKCMHIHGTYKLPHSSVLTLSRCSPPAGNRARNTEKLAARASDISGKKLVHGSGICSRMF